MFWKPRPKNHTVAEKLGRSKDADRLLNDETLNSALDALAEDAFAKLMALPNSAETDRESVVLVAQLRLIKDFRQQLSTYITVGTVAKNRG